MTGVRPKGAVSRVDVLVFAAEMVTYVAAALVAGSHAWWWGVAAVLALAVWWGTLHSPHAPVTLPCGLDLALRVVWFGIGTAALVVLLAGR